MYTRELKYQQLVLVFRLKHNHFKFTIRAQKSKGSFCNETLVLKAGFEMDQKGTTFDHDLYVVVGKQCRTENAYAGHEHFYIN